MFKAYFLFFISTQRTLFLCICQSFYFKKFMLLESNKQKQEFLDSWNFSCDITAKEEIYGKNLSTIKNRLTWVIFCCSYMITGYSLLLLIASATILLWHLNIIVSPLLVWNFHFPLFLLRTPCTFYMYLLESNYHSWH